MAKVNSTVVSVNASAQPTLVVPSVANNKALSDGKSGRVSKRARCFRDIIGRASKKMRGRIGGEMPKDERYFERRDERVSRVNARLRSEQHFTREQLRLVSEEPAFA